LAELDVKRIPELDPVTDYLNIALGDMLALYDQSGDITLRMTVQQLKNLLTSDRNRAIFTPVVDIVQLKNINTTDSNIWVQFGIINVSTRGLYQLDRNSTLDADNENIIAPNMGPGKWLLLFKNQANTAVAYDAGKEYNDTGGLNTYAVWNLKYWEYYNSTPTTQTEREGVLGAGNGYPYENIYWREVSKADIDNIAGGDLKGTYPNPEIATVDGGEI
jgi:hypothetical protein